jgi:23S rRNA (uracil1939-C5)-methyltransferase
VSETILRLAARGDGVTASGKYVSGAAPGDVLREDGRIEPGPNRVTPPCKHFGACGGCQLQHVDDETYARFLQDRIASALASQGIEGTSIAAPALSAPRTRRRVALRAQRQGKRITLGHSEEKSHRIVDLAECAVMHPKLFALLRPLRTLLVQLVPDRKQGDVQMTLTDQGVDLMLSGVSVEGLEATEAVTDFAMQHRLARLSIDEGFGAEARYEPDPVTITLGGVAVGFPAGAFLQATTEGEAALVAAVHTALGACQQGVDLFAGLGTFALAVPGIVAAAEGAREAALSLKSAANRSGRSLDIAHRDLFRRPFTSSELAAFDAVILDPPRAGAREQIDQLARSQVPRIAYVSCNPSTFARDAKALIDGGYSLEHIQPVGQFRWSTHVELAARFLR